MGLFRRNKRQGVPAEYQAMVDRAMRDAGLDPAAMQAYGAGEAPSLREMQRMKAEAEAEAERYRRERGLGPGDLAPAAPQAQDPLDALAALADRRDRGEISEADFAAERARLLGEL